MTLSNDGLLNEVHRTALLFEPVTRILVVHAEREVDGAVLSSLYWRRADETGYRVVWRAPDSDAGAEALWNIRTPVLAGQRPLLFFSVWESDNEKHELRPLGGGGPPMYRRGWDWMYTSVVDLRTMAGSAAVTADHLASTEDGWSAAWIAELLGVSDDGDELLVVRADMIATRVRYRVGWQRIGSKGFRSETTLRNVTY